MSQAVQSATDKRLLYPKHYLMMIGGTISIPMILSGPMCFADKPLVIAEVLNTVLFCSGIVTLLQTTFGVRLPILQGGTFAFMAPTFAILSLPKFQCPVSGITNSTNNVSSTPHDDGEIWKIRMREETIGGFLFCKYNALNNDNKQRHNKVLTIALIALFSMFLQNIKTPFPSWNKSKGWYIARFPFFRLFPVIIAIIIAWIVCGIVTAAGGFPDNPAKPGYLARTDARTIVLKEAKWFRFPYPGQWGLPTVSAAGVFGMVAGVLASIIESVGDYYACARLSGAPPPPKHAINRGIGIEGIGCFITGIWGSDTKADDADTEIKYASFRIYDLPFGLNRLSSFKFAKYVPCLPYYPENGLKSAEESVKMTPNQEEQDPPAD
ncbi:Solute carrier family 23 member 2 [Exaiptasia diaphana]|nr:Solute carrier family 23 member 2 [Exaiptasia diaphana]